MMKDMAMQGQSQGQSIVTLIVVHRSSSPYLVIFTSASYHFWAIMPHASRQARKSVFPAGGLDRVTEGLLCCSADTGKGGVYNKLSSV